MLEHISEIFRYPGIFIETFISKIKEYFNVKLKVVYRSGNKHSVLEKAFMCTTSVVLTLPNQ